MLFFFCCLKLSIDTDFLLMHVNIFCMVFNLIFIHIALRVYQKLFFSKFTIQNLYLLYSFVRMLSLSEWSCCRLNVPLICQNILLRWLALKWTFSFGLLWLWKGVYGDVQRVKILYNKKDSALIQMADGNQSQLGKITFLFVFPLV